MTGTLLGSALLALLTGCSSGPKAPPNVGQIIIQSGTSVEATTVQMWGADFGGPTTFNLGASTAGIAISAAGTPVPGAIYLPGKADSFYRINPGSSPISVSTAGKVISAVHLAPHGAKNAGAAMVLTDRGLTTLQAGGGHTDIPIPDAAELAVAPEGVPNAGTAYVTSKTSSSVYVVDPLAESAHELNVGMVGGGLAVAPTGTPDAGTVFVYPDPGNTDIEGLPAPVQLTAISPEGGLRTAALPANATSSQVAAAVAPAKTKHAGSLYFTGLKDGLLYQLSPAGDLSSVPVLPVDNMNPEAVQKLAIAAAGTKNAGNVYVATDQRIFQVDPAGQVTTVLTNNSDIPGSSLTLLAIAPPKTPTAGTVYVAAAPVAGGQPIVAIKTDGTQATFTFPQEVKPSSGTVAPAGTKLAGTLLAWGFYGQGVATLSPTGSIGVLGGDRGVIAVAVVPKRS